jgi:hypothetical protein
MYERDFLCGKLNEASYIVYEAFFRTSVILYKIPFNRERIIGDECVKSK